MRKDLVITLPSTEKGIDIIIRDYAGAPGFILIQHDSYKFGINEATLRKAIDELDLFRRMQTPTPVAVSVENDVSDGFDIEYGEDDA